jgi:predicted RNase H-like HicB family nuclease
MFDNLEKAKMLASRPYILVVMRDYTTVGDDYVYVALNPEIEGCKAQGLTMDEAQENLEEVRVDLIEHLIEHGLTVPEPDWQTTTTTGSNLVDIEEIEGELNIEIYLENNTQTDIREQLIEA